MNFIDFDVGEVTGSEHVRNDRQRIAVQVGNASYHDAILRQELRRLILVADFFVRFDDGGQHILVIEAMAGSGQIRALGCHLARQSDGT